MIKEKQNAQSKAYRVGEFKNRKAIGDAARYLFINLPEKLPTSASVLKVIIEKAAPKKEIRQTKAVLTI